MTTLNNEVDATVGTSNYATDAGLKRPPTIEELAGRISALEAHLTGMANQVVTRRLVIVGPDGRERIIAEVDNDGVGRNAGEAVVRVLADGIGKDNAEVTLAAFDAGGAGMNRGASAGVRVSSGGTIVGGLEAEGGASRARFDAVQVEEELDLIDHKSVRFARFLPSEHEALRQTARLEIGYENAGNISMATHADEAELIVDAGRMNTFGAGADKSSVVVHAAAGWRDEGAEGPAEGSVTIAFGGDGPEESLSAAGAVPPLGVVTDPTREELSRRLQVQS